MIRFNKTILFYIIICGLLTGVVEFLFLEKLGITHYSLISYIELTVVSFIYIIVYYIFIILLFGVMNIFTKNKTVHNLLWLLPFFLVIITIGCQFIELYSTADNLKQNIIFFSILFLYFLLPCIFIKIISRNRKLLAVYILVGLISSISILTYNLMLKGNNHQEKLNKIFYKEKKNNTDIPIIWITIDTLRADHLSCYGYNRRTSPAIDKLAEDGVKFTNAIASSSWTKPSTASMLTGQYPFKHEAIKKNGILANNIFTIAEILNFFNYNCYAFISNGWITPQFGFNRGFKLYFANIWNSFYFSNSLIYKVMIPELKQKIFSAVSKSKKNLLNNYIGSFPPHFNNDKRTCLEIVNWSKKILNKYDLRKTFQYYHFIEPHAVYIPPNEHKLWKNSAYKGIEIIGPLYYDRETKKILKKYDPKIKGIKKDSLEEENAISLYDGEIHFVDSAVDKLLQFYKEKGIYQKSIIILTADHGDELNDHGSWDHNHTLYQELLHVPLIIKFPFNKFGGKKIDNYVSIVDIVPTMLEYLNIKISTKYKFNGHSLLSLIKDNQAIEREYLYAEKYNKNFMDFPNFRKFGKMQTVISTEGYKIIKAYDKISDKLIKTEFYNIKKDPYEQKLLKDENNKLKDLKSALKKISKLKKNIKNKTQIDVNLKKNLKALGYLN